MDLEIKLYSTRQEKIYFLVHINQLLSPLLMKVGNPLPPGNDMCCLGLGGMENMQTAKSAAPVDEDNTPILASIARAERIFPTVLDTSSSPRVDHLAMGMGLGIGG